MANINFTVTDEKLPRIITAMKGLHPIPMIEDPEWVDPEDGTTVPQIPEFTDNQWAKEAVRRWVVKEVQRWETSKAMREAKDGVTPDDTIIQ